MNARPLLVGLACASVGLSGAAGAAPVTQSRLAVATAQIALTHGRYVELTLRLASSAGAETLRVESRTCRAAGCGDLTYSSGSVSGSEVSTTTAQARLRTVLDGVPVDVTWTATNDGTLVLGGTDANGNDDGDTVSTYKAERADVTISVDGVTCTSTGAVGDEVRASDSANDAAGPLSELELPRGVLSC